jgi:hypothetical protein
VCVSLRGVLWAPRRGGQAQGLVGPPAVAAPAAPLTNHTHARTRSTHTPTSHRRAQARCPLGLKYGCDPAEAPRLLKSAAELGLAVVGVSFHVGSGCKCVP